eukprot:TRINITY_DN11479_c0_g1_i1.p1 TRINITY_DN11479_c0_g1~~TRINITY_DN11479_c0_g1_i1.p1  ORF type:complete len:432 (-),score=84.67 TRINITY_DN11479_c0_g1_i1:79-1374(-)
MENVGGASSYLFRPVSDLDARGGFAETNGFTSRESAASVYTRSTMRKLDKSIAQPSYHTRSSDLDNPARSLSDYYANVFDQLLSGPTRRMPLDLTVRQPPPVSMAPTTSPFDLFPPTTTELAAMNTYAPQRKSSMKPSYDPLLQPRDRISSYKSSNDLLLHTRDWAPSEHPFERQAERPVERQVERPVERQERQVERPVEAPKHTTPNPSRTPDPPQNHESTDEVYKTIAKLLFWEADMLHQIEGARRTLAGRPDFDVADVFHSIVCHGGPSPSVAAFSETILHMTSLRPSEEALHTALRSLRGSTVELADFKRLVGVSESRARNDGKERISEETVLQFSKVWWMLFTKEEEMRTMRAEVKAKVGARIQECVVSVDLHRKGYVTIHDIEYLLRCMGFTVDGEAIRLLFAEVVPGSSDRLPYDVFARHLTEY